ncbi:hypothetical protein INT43_009151 [Umbelopsis isabellina]|uniref:Uncharacterized protein n=1 Tax=Mortierella isabellina TaxID=91625 RepID=A0A8H7PD47_MORIS|nr:hypothetical protein INT43_009151 [Umbelopsis isabellina]
MTAITSQSPELDVHTKTSLQTISSASPLAATSAGNNSPFRSRRRKLPLRTVTDPTRPSQILDSQEDYEDKVSMPTSPRRRLPLTIGTPEGVKDSSVRRDIHRPSYSIASRLGAASPSTFDISTHSIIPDHMKAAVCNSPLTPRSEARRVRFLDLQTQSVAMDLTRSLADTARESSSSLPASDDDEITNQDQDNPFDVGEHTAPKWSLLADIAPYKDKDEAVNEETLSKSPTDKMSELFPNNDKTTPSPVLELSSNEKSLGNAGAAEILSPVTNNQVTELREASNASSSVSSEKDESGSESSSSNGNDSDSSTDGSDSSNANSGDERDIIADQREENADVTVSASSHVNEGCKPASPSVLKPSIKEMNVLIPVPATGAKKPVSVPAGVWKMNAVPSRSRQPSKENERWVERPINALSSVKRKSATSPLWSVKKLNAKNNSKGRTDARQFR